MAYGYNPFDVITTWRGVPFEGFAEDTIVQCEFDEDAIVKTVGAKGEVTLTLNANKGGKVRVQLQQGSPTNALLSALCAQGRAPGPTPVSGGIIKGPFIVGDLGGLSYALAPEAVILKIPNLTRKKAHEPCEWVWEVPAWTKFVNGGVFP